MIKNILTGVIVGDALGSAVDGLARGHLRSHFRNIHDYIDPSPALKHKTESWRTPGLYSSISQFMLILGITCSRHGPCADAFRQAVASTPDISGYDYGLFRYPDMVEKMFIQRARNEESTLLLPVQPCTRIIPALTALSFRDNSQLEHISDVTAVVRLFTQDLSTLAAALIYSSLIRTLVEEGASGDEPMRIARDAAVILARFIESNSAAVFAQSVNPATLVEEIGTLAGTLSEILNADTPESAEELIVARVNSSLKTPVTRATVNMPGALFPYALAIVSLQRSGETALFRAVMEGGSTAPLAAITGAVEACRHDGSLFPDTLARNLVNRKKIRILVDAIAHGTGSSRDLNDCIVSEAALTSKDREDLAAKLKHARRKPKPAPQSRSEKERELARHAVESWTKYDKARWKKERQRKEKTDNS